MKKPQALTAQVIVAGGGTAGMMAAISAARLGLDTLVLEQEQEIGGTPVQALMASFANLFVNLEGRALVGSLPLELLERMAATGEMVYENGAQAVCGKIGQPFTVPYQPQTYVRVLREMANEAGVRILCGAQLTGVETAPDGQIASGWAEHLGQTLPCFAQVWVDATGDAALAALAGAPCVKDSASSFGCLMRIGGVDIEKYLSWLFTACPWKQDAEYTRWLCQYTNLSEPKLRASKLWRKLIDPIFYGHAPMLSPDDIAFTPRKLAYLKQRWSEEGVIYTAEMCWLRYLLRAAAENGDFALDKALEGGGRITFNNDGFAYGAWGPGVVLCNIAQPYDLDACDPRQQQQAQTAAQNYNREAFCFFKQYVPGFEDAVLLDIAPRAVARFPRMIEGLQCVRPEDVTGEVKLAPNGIYMFGGGNAFKKGFSIPYGMIVPKKAGNLLVAGKGASGAKYCRSQVSCMCMGVAAGAAAQLMIKLSCTAQDVPMEPLQNQLKSLGVILWE